MQLIVLGTARSGSSIVTRLLNLMGAHFTVNVPSVGFKDEGPKGFWERSDVNECNEDILAYHKCRWDQLKHWKFQSAIPKKVLTDLAETAERMKEIVATLDKEKPWVIKDPRMCLTFNHWKPLLKEAVPIIVWRHPLEVAVSFKATHGMPWAQGLALWEYYNAALLSSMKGMEPIFIAHEDLLNKPKDVIDRLLNTLKARGVPLHAPDAKEWDAFFHPELKNSTLDSFDAPDMMLTAFQEELLAIFKGKEKLAEKIFQPSALAVDTMQSMQDLLEQQEKFEENNRKVAALEQQCRQLTNELEDMNQQAVQVKAAAAKLEDMKNELEYHRSRRRGLLGRLFRAA